MVSSFKTSDSFRLKRNYNILFAVKMLAMLLILSFTANLFETVNASPQPPPLVTNAVRISYTSMDCSGEPFDILELEETCFVASTLATVQWNILDMGFLNLPIYTMGPLSPDPYVNFGIDCTDLSNIKLHAYVGGPLCTYASPLQVSTFAVPTGERASRYCVSQSPTSSFILDCPTTVSPTPDPTLPPSSNPPTFAPFTMPPFTMPPSFPPFTMPPSFPPFTMPPSFPPFTMPPSSPPSSVCVPQFKMTKNACTRRIKKCKGQSIKMKWTGPGCKDKRGKKMGDGGCQCVGYCGYQCPKACRSDRECKWENGTCKNKNGNAGVPMPTCNVPG